MKKNNAMTVLLLTFGLAVGIVGTAAAQSDNQFPQVKVIMTIKAPVDRAFNYIVPVDLSHIFKRYENFPAIIRTDEKEKWEKAGLKRTVYFEDGSTSEETLLTVVPPSSFSYRIENFTSSLRFLAKRIEGDWLFTDTGNGQTNIVWTYRIVPKNFIARGIINLVLLKKVKGLLTNALTTLKADLEATPFEGTGSR